MYVSRTIQLALAALIVALPAAALDALADALTFRIVADVLPFLAADAYLLHAALAVPAVAVWTLLYRGLRERRPARLAAGVPALAVLAPVWAWLALKLNRLVLPDFGDPRSLAWNGALLAAFALVVAGFAWAGRRWQEGAWSAGRTSPGWALVVLAAPPGVYFAGHGGGRDPGPDVLVILLDVLRADHLGCYGYERPTSPNIDALAEDGVLFENLIAASTYTKTSVASLFTGLGAFHHGVYTGSDGGGSGKIESDLLSDRFITLAEVMREYGLNTSAWVMNGHVRDYLGYAQGFNYYVDQAGPVFRIAEGYRRWKDRWVGDTRTFSYLHVIDLHGPYDPRPPYLGRFGEPTDLEQRIAAVSWTDFKTGVHRGELEFELADFEELEARYDELICYVDEWVGHIVQDLKDTGRYDDTLIIVTSDHGEAFWEHGFIAHSSWPYEELGHVPLIVKLPDSRGAGRRVERMVGHVDLAPTLIEYVGGEAPDHLDGQSFLPLLLDEQAELEPRMRFIEYRDIVGVRTERWKYIRAPAGGAQLYDLERDPGELHDVIDEHPEVARDLAAACDYVLAEKAKGKAERVILDEETIESLEALGYL